MPIEIDFEGESRKFGVSGMHMVVTREISHNFPSPPPVRPEDIQNLDIIAANSLAHSRAFRLFFQVGRNKFDHLSSLWREQWSNYG